MLAWFFLDACITSAFTTWLGQLSDASLPVFPGGQFEHEVQWLHQVSKGVNRFFICRNLDCSTNGNFYGLNTSWISTVEDGGWEFMCPVCGQPYKCKDSSAKIKAHHIWALEKTKQFMLSAWAASAEENTIVELMKLLSEEDLKPWEEMAKSEVQAAVTMMVRKSAVPLNMTKMHISQEIKEWVVSQNHLRTKKKKWSYPMLEDGFLGSFYKVTDESPVMSEEDTKKFLACVFVFMRRKAG